jgi:hypothetical protein
VGRNFTENEVTPRPPYHSTITIGRKRNKLAYPYALHNHVLHMWIVSATYLRVELALDLTWAKHINKNKSQLDFIKRNIPIQNSKLKKWLTRALEDPFRNIVLPYGTPTIKST